MAAIAKYGGKIPWYSDPIWALIAWASDLPESFFVDELCADFVMIYVPVRLFQAFMVTGCYGVKSYKDGLLSF